MMFCGKCGQPLQEGAKYCGACGAKMEDNGYSSDAQPERPEHVSYSQMRQSFTGSYQSPESDPLSFWQYIGIFILTSIPIVNIIMLLIWCFGRSVNLNKKNYARALLALTIVTVVFWIIMTAVFSYNVMGEMGNYMKGV